MKSPMLHFTFRLLFAKNAQIIRLLSACICVHLWILSSVSHASPPISHEAHFHGVHGYEGMRARDSLYAATKQALNLNVGEPRTVRMIYFLPNDRPFRQDVVDSMKTMMRRIQTFYADQMQAHGYGRMTFRLETDAQGEPLVHRLDGQHPDSHYLDNTWPSMTFEISEVFSLRNNNIYFIVIDNSTGSIQHGRYGSVAGIGGEELIDPGWGPYAVGGFVFVPSGFSFSTVAHEFGHAFGLKHDFRDKTYIMSYGGSLSDRLSACAARVLSVHPCFNSDIPIPTGESRSSVSTIELVSPVRYPASASSVSLQLKVVDPEGLHQVTLYANTKAIAGSAGFAEVLACRELAGEKETVVEFEYDGVVPSAFLLGIPESLSDLPVHQLRVETLDTDGYTIDTSFLIAQNSPYLVTTLEGQDAVAFSPDGNTLASVLFTGWIRDSETYRTKIRLWNVATMDEIATFDKSLVSITSLAFSPDGNTLASTSGHHPIRLWDVATRKEIGTMAHELDEFGQVIVGRGDSRINMIGQIVFSPDGNTLVSSSSRSTIQLWDVATRKEIATLATDGASFALSPDGNTLASVSDDETIRLWDVATRKEIATLKWHGKSKWPKKYEGYTSVALSPDGKMLASGTRDGYVQLWDVATRKEIATLEGHPSPYSYPYMVIAMVFSPGGDILASKSQEGTTRLWDVATREKIATLLHLNPYGRSLAFSPDGTRLAVATDYNIDTHNIELWDTSKFVTPVAVIPDLNLRAAIRDALGKSAFAPITVPDMARLTVLNASNRNISELDGLASATNLTDLNLAGNPLSSSAISTHIPALQERGVAVVFDKPTPDFSGDGAVDITDFLLFVAQFGLSDNDAGYDARFDLDGDGVIGLGDFLIFVNAFGTPG